MVRRLTVFLLFVFVFIRVIEAQSIIGTLVDDDTQLPDRGGKAGAEDLVCHADTHTGKPESKP